MKLSTVYTHICNLEHPKKKESVNSMIKIKSNTHMRFLYFDSIH